ncbi:hypothetical protein IJ556_03665 [bacterium]|nr:hypothetical protein [Clostridia bacterium]MBR1373532.1 hypothetical protein [bacterium]
MEITEELLDFLCLSQGLIRANLLITDMEKSIIEIRRDGTIDYSARKISEELKNLDLPVSTIKNKGSLVQPFGEPIPMRTELMAPICHQGEQIGFLIYHMNRSEFFYKETEFADTAKYFIERFINRQKGIEKVNP